MVLEELGPTLTPTPLRCLDPAVAYSKPRVQCGRPIGSVQARRHRMADRYDADLPLRAAVAQVHCSAALQRVTTELVARLAPLLGLR